MVFEGIVWRYRTGSPWRDVPEWFGPWQTLWKRHNRWTGDGTWDRLLTELSADADAAGELDWVVAVDSSINRAHQHAAGAAPVAADSDSTPGGWVELQESGRCARSGLGRTRLPGTA